MKNFAYEDDSKQPRYELIGGEAVMLAAPNVNHSIVSGNIYAIFRGFLRGKRCLAFGDNTKVYLSERNHFIPDAMIVCNRKIVKRNGIYGAPDLVAEVLSPRTAKFDRGLKKEAYAKAGVREYWIVDTVTKSVEVYYLREKNFRLDNVYHIYSPDEWKELSYAEKAQETLSVKVSLYDDFIVDLREIFDNVMNWQV